MSLIVFFWQARGQTTPALADSARSVDRVTADAFHYPETAGSCRAMTEMGQPEEAALHMTVCSAPDSGRSREVNLMTGSHPKPLTRSGADPAWLPIPSANTGREHNADVRAEPLHTRTIGKPIIPGLAANSDDVIFCENRQLALQKPSSSQKTSEEWPTGRIRSRHARQFA